jgi:hypothetical protein
MKKTLIIIYLTFLYFGTNYANEISSQLFGIKIYDNIKNYIIINTDKKSDSTFFLNTKEKPFNGLIKNFNLDAYQLNTNKQKKILQITGVKNFSEVGNKNFENKCENESSSFKILLSNNYNKNISEFNKKYYKNSNQMGRDYLFFSNELKFNKGSKKLILQIMCSYTSIDNYVHSTLYVSLIDEKYLVQNSLKVWKRTKTDNNILVELNL